MKKSKSLKMKAYISFLIIILPFYALSQDTVCKFLPHWYVDANIGISYSQGDIAKYTDFPKLPDFKNIGTGLEIGFGRQLSQVLGVNASFYYGLLKGESKNGDNFESDLFDFKLNATVNFNKLFNKSSDNKLNFHARAGIGQAQYRTKVLDARGTTLYGYDKSLGGLRGNGIEGRRVAMIYPISLGLDYKLADNMLLYADFMVKLTNTDLIDGQIAGNNNDNYNFTSIGIRFNFHKKKKLTAEQDTVEVIKDKLAEKPIQSAELNQAKDSVLSKVMVEQLSDLIVAKLKPVIEAEIASKPIIEEKHETKQTKEIGEKQTIHDAKIPETSKQSITSKASIEYFVQIRASFKQALEISDLSRKFNLDKSKIIYSGIYNDWYIYTVGSFASKKDAAQERENLIKNHGVDGAFIIHFENGKKIND